MKHSSHIACMTVLLLGSIAGTAWSADPDMTAPLSMQMDTGSFLRARRLDFFEHPLSGATNFNPQNTQLQLPGDLKLSVQDVIPYMGTEQLTQNCKEYAEGLYLAAKPFISLMLDYLIPDVFDTPAAALPKSVDPDVIYTGSLDNCSKMAAVDQKQLFAKNPLVRQPVADVRNTTAGSSEILFSAKQVDPYVAFPIGVSGYFGTVIGGGQGTDTWNDGFVSVAEMANLTISLFAQNSKYARSTISFYRFLPDKAANQKKVLQLAGFSPAWIDKKLANNPCFKEDGVDAAGKPKYAVRPDAELAATGCVGESLSVGVVAPHLFVNPNAALESQGKSKDLVVLNRDWIGNRKGYITVYRRTAVVPDDKSQFPHLWKFERAVTNTLTGIPEPYDLTVLHDTVPGATTDSVVVTSNVPQTIPDFKQNAFLLYLYNENKQDASPLFAGLVAPEDAATPAAQVSKFGPYRIYSADFNADGCADILLTRARIVPDINDLNKVTAAMAPYFDQYLRIKMPNGTCGGFPVTPNRYEIPAIDPQKTPQISSLAIADFDKDGLLDVMAADFNFYINNNAKTHENYAYFLKGTQGGLFTIAPTLPKYIVNTIPQLGTAMGPVDIKADAFSNLATVIGTATAYVPLKTPPPEPIVANITNYCETGDVIPAVVCNCIRDMDGDKLPELGLKYANGNAITEITVTDCSGNKITIPLNNTPVTLTDCQSGATTTKTGRAWLLTWALGKLLDGTPSKCDNCADFVGTDKCAGPEEAGKPICNNKSQTDSDSDGFGDICDASPKDNTQSRAAPIQMLPLAQKKPVLREDRVIDLNAGAIAHADELMPVFTPIELGNNVPEVTVLLNKTKIGGTPPPPPVCPNGDPECICKQNPALQLCVCQNNPNAPGCKVDPTAQTTCCVDVCREGLSAPFPKACDYIRPYNDEIRKITGLCIDLLAPPEGTQYHISCTLPNAAAFNLNDGHSYMQIFKTGQVPRNYFKNTLRPVASENILKEPVLLNPASAELNAQFDISKLPQPSFNYNVLDAVVPDVVINQAPGVAQIDNVMQVETFMADLSASLGQAAGSKMAPLLDIKGFTSPSGCMWQNDDCPDPMTPPPSAQQFVDAVRATVTQYEAAGKPITQSVLVDAMKSMNVGSEFMHQQFIIPGAEFNANNQLAPLVIPQQMVMAGYSTEGGCGCRFATASTARNTLEPIVMLLASLAGMLILRRRTAKKH